MLYSYNDFNFDIIFNSNDFNIQIEHHEKLYGNVFIFEEIKLTNNFFTNIEIIEKIIKNCLEQKEFYSLEIKETKFIKLEFLYTNELSNIELILDIYPIRKDLSTNTEIIELKKKVNKLENIISNFYDHTNFIFDNSSIMPLNLSYTQPLCFSNLDNLMLNILVGYHQNISSHYGFPFKDIYSTDTINMSNYKSPTPNGSEYTFQYYNKNKIVNYNIKILANKLYLLKKLKVSQLIFYNINFEINDTVLEHLQTPILFFINCTINFTKNIKTTFTKIYFYSCTIKTIDGLSNNKTSSTIEIAGRTFSLNTSLFPSNIVINNIAYDYPTYYIN
jgi:hypothetical protein